MNKFKRKLKNKIDTMHLGRIYFDKVIKNREQELK